MNDVLDPAAVKAAVAATATLIPHLTGAGVPAPVTGAGVQVAHALIDERLRWIEAAAAAVQSLRPGPDVGISDRRLFAASGSAVAWFEQTRSSVLTTLELAASIGADEQLWRMASAIEPLASLTGDLDLWGRVSQAGLRAAERLGEPQALAFMHLMRGGWHKMTNPASSIPDYTEALRRFRRLGDERMELLTLIRLGAVHLVLRRLPEAEACFEQVVARSTDDAAIGLGVMNLAAVRLDAGDYGTAVNLSHRALELLAEADPHYAVQVYIQLVSGQVRVGDLEAATEAWLAGSAQAGIGPVHAGRRLGLLAAEAELRLAQNRPGEAVELAHRWLVCHGELGTDTGHADVLDLLGQGVLAQRDPVRALDIHEAALGRRRRAGVPFYTARTLMHLAAARVAAGFSADAENNRTDAVALLAGYVDPAADQLRADLAAGE
jgi:tetratricopeptide (TPR) repeat protein